MEPSLLSLIFGNIGCLLATIILFLCGFHSLYIYCQRRTLLHQSQLKAMIMEFIMILLFLSPTMSYILSHNTLFCPYHTDDHTNDIFECRIAILSVFPPYSLGKTVLYVILMHRVHILFHKSPLATNKTLPFILTILLLFTVIPMSVLNAINVFHTNNKVYVKTYTLNGYHIGLCQLDFDTKKFENKLLVLYLPIVNIIIEIFIAVYLIYSFVSRLNALRTLRTLTHNNTSIALSIVDTKSKSTSEKSKTLSEPAAKSNSKHVSKDSIVDILVNTIQQERTDKLKELTKQQTILGIAAVSSSMLFYAYSMETVTPDFIGWNILINTLSVHLMFGYSQFLWNGLCCKKRKITKMTIS